MKIYISLFLMSVGYCRAFGQKTPIGTWQTGTIVLPGDSLYRWGACTGFQTRFNDGWKQLQYQEVNGGITYYISRSFTALTGLEGIIR